MIAGDFDRALVDKWVDYLFADWSGHAASVNRHAPLPPPAASLAMTNDSSLVALQLAIPAHMTSRPQRLVAAAMLNAIAGDVRHRLGAAYTIAAQLVEQRRASNYMLAGYVDAKRAADALQLLRDELAALMTDDDAAARAFIVARQRVLVQLRSVSGGAVALAARVEHDIDLEHEPLSDLGTAREVQALTIDSMRAALAELDLERAIVLMRGPQAELEQSFAVLGRTPTIVKVATVDRDTADDDPTETTADPVAPHHNAIGEISDSLTVGGENGRHARIAVTIAPGYTFASTVNDVFGVTEACCEGYTLSVHLGARYNRTRAIGGHLTIGHLTGSYYIDPNRLNTIPVDEVPILLAGSLHLTAFDRVWAELFFGLHLDHKTTPHALAPPITRWSGGLGGGVQLGVDALNLDGHRLGAFIMFDGTLATEVGYAAFTLGAAYRY